MLIYAFKMELLSSSDLMQALMAKNDLFKAVYDTGVFEVRTRTTSC